MNYFWHIFTSLLLQDLQGVGVEDAELLVITTCQDPFAVVAEGRALDPIAVLVLVQDLQGVGVEDSELLVIATCHVMSEM